MWRSSPITNFRSLGENRAGKTTSQTWMTQANVNGLNCSELQAGELFTRQGMSVHSSALMGLWASWGSITRSGAVHLKQLTKPLKLCFCHLYPPPRPARGIYALLQCVAVRMLKCCCLQQCFFFPGLRRTNVQISQLLDSPQFFAVNHFRHVLCKGSSSSIERSVHSCRFLVRFYYPPSASSSYSEDSN